MSKRQATVRSYAAAFATRDVPAIVNHVSVDVVWELNGQQVGAGREAFEQQVSNDLATGSAVLTIDRFIEDVDTVIALQHGQFIPYGLETGTSFASVEVYTFDGDTIAKIETCRR